MILCQAVRWTCLVLARRTILVCLHSGKFGKGRIKVWGLFSGARLDLLAPVKRTVHILVYKRFWDFVEIISSCSSKTAYQCLNQSLHRYGYV